MKWYEVCHLVSSNWWLCTHSWRLILRHFQPLVQEVLCPLNTLAPYFLSLGPWVELGCHGSSFYLLEFACVGNSTGREPQAVSVHPAALSILLHWFSPVGSSSGTLFPSVFRTMALRACVTFCSFTHLEMDVWLIFTFWLLWIALL